MSDKKIQLEPEIARDVARQCLDSLRRAGVHTLPNATGRYQFEFGIESETTIASEPETKTGGEQVREKAPRKKSSRTSASAKGSSSAGSTGGGVRVNSDLFVGNLDGYESRRIDPADVSARQSALQVIQNEVESCTACPELVANRTRTVFGVGRVSPRLCFLGEGPGADEDRQGEPFVGAAGQLLNKIIGACKMQREDVYILNTVKCRPPGNRNPGESELGNCWGYAVRQLEILQPEFICCLGSVAARTLLDTKQSIGRMRGQFFSFRGSQVVVTYHPAYLLRNPDAKRLVWDDMKMLMAKMGIKL